MELIKLKLGLSTGPSVWFPPFEYDVGCAQDDFEPKHVVDLLGRYFQHPLGLVVRFRKWSLRNNYCEDSYYLQETCDRRKVGLSFGST